MKKTAAVLLTIIALAFTMQAKDVKLFKDKSGIIEYELSGSKQGKIIVKFDDYGDKMTVESDFLFNGTPNKSISWVEGDTSYVYDYEKKKGYKLPYFSKIEYAKLYTGSVAETYRKQYKKHLGNMSGLEKVYGKKCERWEVPAQGKIIWMWEGYRMKETYNAIETLNYTETVSKMKIGASIPSSHFVKKDIDYQVFSVQNIDAK